MLTRSHRFRWTHILGCVVMLALVLAYGRPGLCCRRPRRLDTAAAGGGQAKFFIIWLVAFAGSIAALVQAYLFYKWVLSSDPGNERMMEIAGYVREGANAYLRQQYIVVAGFFVVIVGLLSIAAFGLRRAEQVCSVRLPDRRFLFRSGRLDRHANGHDGQQPDDRGGPQIAQPRPAGGVPFGSGDGPDGRRPGVAGHHAVVRFPVLDLAAVWALSELSLVEITVTMLCFGMGASSQALFARVGGGIFTKAADVGADLVGKVEQGIPEDDPRNPATIADNVGDNVGDVAGMGADLYESYCGSILATAALGVAAYASPLWQR